MRLALTISQIVLSIVLLGLVILQAKGVGLGSSFGGSGEFYQSKRGVEKVVFNATLLVVFLFFVLSCLNAFLR